MPSPCLQRSLLAVKGSTRLIEVLLLTQDDCKFCDEAKAILTRLGAVFPLRINTAELSSSQGQALALEAGLLFPPGILINGRPFFQRPTVGKEAAPRA